MRACTLRTDQELKKKKYVTTFMHVTSATVELVLLVRLELCMYWLCSIPAPEQLYVTERIKLRSEMGKEKRRHVTVGACLLYVVSQRPLPPSSSLIFKLRDRAVTSIASFVPCS